MKTKVTRNTSGLKPLGHAVLVRPYELQKKDSLIVLPDTAKERSMMVETRAVVIECGPEAWRDEQGPRAKPGDRVLISRYAGSIVRAEDALDGVSYRFVNDNDIYCAIEVEEP